MATIPTTMLFLDESTNERVRPSIASMTGLLLPVEKYDQLRLGLYQLHPELQSDTSRPATTTPSELHGRDLLRDQKDEDRLEVLHGLVELLGSIDLEVARVGYFMTDAMKETFGDGYSLAFFGLMTALAPLTSERFVIPIHDAGFNESFGATARALSKNAKIQDVLRSNGIGVGYVGGQAANLSEIVHAESLFSAPLQGVDLVSSLRSLFDARRVDAELSLTPHKEAWLAIAERLTGRMVVDALVAMSFNGDIQGPPEFAPC